MVKSCLMPDDNSDAAISFVEKLLVLLDEGAFTATYKYAVLLALIDLCMERAAPDGGTPARLPTAAIAEKVVALYWPHSSLFRGTGGAVVLRQNSGGQAAILSAIMHLRERLGSRTATTAGQARTADPDSFAALVRDVEWKLVQMPLPRLQQFGNGYDPFLYDIDWTTDVRRSDFVGGAHDFAVRLRPGVGGHLVRLNGLLRPLIKRQWADLVTRFNRDAVEESTLEEFLFGMPRRPTGGLLRGLRELQANRCFYCQGTMRHALDIDHFIPWARHPDDAIHNLVVAHRLCNNSKRDFLAAAPHVARWSQRLRGPTGQQLHQLAIEQRWASHLATSRNVARAIYLRLPDDAKLSGCARTSSRRSTVRRSRPHS
jgi:5-methylcytosine-specific restriction endonuclease McrA